LSASYSFKFVASGLHTSTDKGVSHNTKSKFVDDTLTCVKSPFEGLGYTVKLLITATGGVRDVMIEPVRNGNG